MGYCKLECPDNETQYCICCTKIEKEQTIALAIEIVEGGGVE